MSYLASVISIMAETEFGRGLIAEGREEGLEEGREQARRDAIVEVLAARFPHASVEQQERTARRLLGEQPDIAIARAVSLADLDP